MVPKYRALTARHTPISVPRKELRGGTSVCSLEEETSAQTQGTFLQTSASFPGSGVLRLALLTPFLKFTFLGISQLTRLYLHHFHPSFLHHLFRTPHRPLGLMITFCCCYCQTQSTEYILCCRMHIGLRLTPQTGKPARGLFLLQQPLTACSLSSVPSQVLWLFKKYNSP